MKTSTTLLLLEIKRLLMTYSFFVNDCFADLLFLPLSWIWYSQVQSKPHFRVFFVEMYKRQNSVHLLGALLFKKSENTDRIFYDFQHLNKWRHQSVNITSSPNYHILLID